MGKSICTTVFRTMSENVWSQCISKHDNGSFWIVVVERKPLEQDCGWSAKSGAKQKRGTASGGIDPCDVAEGAGRKKWWGCTLGKERA